MTIKMAVSLGYQTLAIRPIPLLSWIPLHGFHSLNRVFEETTIAVPKSTNMLQAKPSGKKFIDLIRDMDQKATYLAKLERINPVPIEPSQTLTTKKSTSELDMYSEDPEFPFKRKRGKKHIMARRNNDPSLRSDVLASQHEVEESRLFVEALDISRRKPTVTRITIVLPPKKSATNSPDEEAAPK